MAQGIADIPLEGRGSLPRSSVEAGLRPAVRVEVLDPHDLWDARDGLVQETINRAAPVVVEAAAPMVVKAVTDRAGMPLFDAAGRTDGLRPAVIQETSHRTIQLGAYSSESGARDAWRGLAAGEARLVLRDLQPRYEKAEVSGRSLVRLKVSAPSDRVAEICRSTRIDAPWCTPVG